MAQQTFGEVSWDSGSGNGSKRANSRDSFLKLENGVNKVRIITKPQQYVLHKVKFGPKDKFGQKIRCSLATGECPVCEVSKRLLDSENTADKERGKFMKAKARWYVGVIDLKDNRVKTLDISWTVFDQIKKLAINEDWGNPTSYPISIIVDENGGATGYYSVQPSPKKPLSAEEQLLADSFPIEDLQRRVTPPELAAVKKRIEFLEKQYQVKFDESTAVSSSVNSESEDVESDSSDDSGDDEDFPSFND